MFKYNYRQFPIGWKVLPLNEATLFLDNQRVPLEESDREQMHGEYPYYGASGIIDHINKYLFDDEVILLAEDGANILLRSTPVAFKATGKFWVNNHAHVLKPREDINIDYLIAYLESLSYVKYNTGSTQPKLNRAVCEKIPVLLPSQNEQKFIASILCTWDTAIEKTERLIEAKEKRFSWLIKSLISNQCRHWVHLQADKIFASISEKKNGNEELLSVTQDRGVIPRMMLEGRVMSPEGSTETYKLIKEGDFAISLRSFQGGLEYSLYQGLISPAYTVLRPKLKIHDEFYRHFFKSYLFIEKYLNIAVIGIRDGKQISIPDFMTVKIPYPPLEQQKQIAETLNTSRQEIDLLKKQAEAYRKQKRGLMQKLLTGEWRVKGE